MRIALAEGFQDEVRALPADRRGHLLDVLPSLPEAFREPGRHIGVGLRKLHATGIWEARLGLDLRLVFTLRRDEVTLLKIGSHDEVRRYLRQL